MLCCSRSLSQSLIYLCLQGRSKAENLNQHLRHQMVNYGVPHVSEYLEARIKCKRVQQDIHTWERKVRIAQVYFTSSVPIGPAFSFCPTSAGSVVLQPSTALVCLAQMTRQESAKAVSPAYSAEGGARSAGHRIPVKLPPLPDHGWKGRKLQLLDAVV